MTNNPAKISDFVRTLPHFRHAMPRSGGQKSHFGPAQPPFGPASSHFGSTILQIVARISHVVERKLHSVETILRVRSTISHLGDAIWNIAQTTRRSGSIAPETHRGPNAVLGGTVLGLLGATLPIISNVIVAMLSALLFTTQTSAQPLYTADLGTPSALYRIDNFLAAPHAVRIGTIGSVSMQDLAADPNSGALYAVDGSRLFSINPNTAAPSVGTLLTPTNVGWNSLEIAPNGTVYAGGFVDTRLYTINLSTGAGTALFDTGERFFGDIAFDPVSGELFVLSVANPQATQAHVRRINVQSQQITTLSTLDHVLTGIEITNEGRIIVVSASESGIWEVDRESGQLSLLGNLGGNHGVGAALVAACPAVIRHPRGTITCPADTASFSVTAAGNVPFTYQWQIGDVFATGDWLNITNGTVFTNSGAQRVGVFTDSQTATLTAAGFSAAGFAITGPVQLRCTVTNACGSVTSNPATLTICVADTDDGSGGGTCDGGVTIDDLLYYLRIFEDGELRADVDDGSSTGTPDGGVTIDDLLYYLVRFEAGC